MPLLWLVIVIAACGGPKPPDVPRELEGQVVRGPFISPYSYEWMVRAERHMVLGNFERAALAFQRARSSSEEDPWLFARLARAQTCAGQLHDAQRTLSQAIERFPGQRWLEQERRFWHEVKPILSGDNDRKAAHVSNHCKRIFGDEHPSSPSVPH